MQTTNEFLASIWPGTGLYCLEVLAPGSTVVSRRWAASVADAAALVSALDAQGCTVYHACSSFKTADNRKHDNALAARSFWVDLDVGDAEAKYHSQAEAVQAIAEFTRDFGFPRPTLVSSGNGIHVYWPLTADITAAQWRTIAERLKAVLYAAHVKQDPSRTADVSSILRPVGSTHRKGAPKPVWGISAGTPVSPLEFETCVENAARKLRVAAVKPRVATDLNAKFAAVSDFPSSSGVKAAEKCAQLAKLRDTRGNMDEPTWYAGIQLIHFTEEGDALAQEWSSGHPSYSFEETAVRLERVKSLGPTSCEHFARCNPDGCAGCPYKGKIKSPIQLGVVLRQAPAPAAGAGEQPPSTQEATVIVTGFGAGVAQAAMVQDDFVHPAKPFVRAEDGIYVELEDEAPVKIYDYDLFPVDLCWDEHLGYETVVIRHFLPQDGWKEFRIRSALVESPKEFNMALRDNHVKPINSKLMAAYMASYMKQLQRSTALRRLWATMGWKDHGERFILGEHAYTRDGVMKAGISIRSKDSVQAYTAAGDRQKWIDMTAVFGVPGAEPYAFMVMAGFGAPLMKFTGFEAALVNSVGMSGVGKTTAAKVALSIFGDYARQKLVVDDTANATLERIAFAGSLPVYIDEITNIDPKALSNFVYRITQGRGKLRLTEKATERATPEWNTIIMSSSNASLIARLGTYKANAEAEMLRVFEYQAGGVFTKEQATYVNHTVRDNYGLVGPEYIQWIVQHTDEVKSMIDRTIASIEAQVGSRPSERYWCAVAAVSLVGGLLAQQLGLVKFEARAVVPWLIRQFSNLRGEKDEQAMDMISVLGTYLNASSGTRLVVSAQKNSKFITVHRQPTSSVHQRMELDTMTLWVEVDHFRRWLAERSMDFAAVKKELVARGITPTGRVKKVVGAGTDLAGAQVDVLHINLQHPAMGQMLAAVTDASKVVDIKAAGA